ncbi:MAG: PAS domain-containing protein [Thermodesulfobacteriota bacterium]|nr:PAS domain-containing protein [Thermodesulfobacteriota bacterium]
MTAKPSYKELEERLGKLEKQTCDYGEIKQELLKLSHAVKQSPSAIMITDTDGRIEYVNPRFTEMTGHSSQEALGMNAADLGEQPREERQRMWDVIRSGSVWQGEFLNKRKSGAPYWERASISAIRDEGGVITHYVKVSEDVSAFKEAQDALRESEKRRYEDQKRMAVFKFANDMALKLMDELRNPLVAIGGFARRIAERDHPQNKLSEYARIMFEQSKKLDSALNRALAHLKAASKEI